MPRIITHGEVIKFICHVCGCVFLNSEDECSREFVGNDGKRIQYYSYCWECGEPRLLGTRLFAKELKEMLNESRTY